MMTQTIAVIVSTKDIAALNIKSALIESGFKKIEDKFDNYPTYSHKNAKLCTTDNPCNSNSDNSGSGPGSGSNPGNDSSSQPPSFIER